MKKLIPILSVALCGCASVPATKFTLNPKTGAVEIQSPKEIQLNGLRVGVAKDSVQVTIESYSSHNSPDVIAAVASANANMAAQVSALADKAIAAAVQAAAKAAVP